MIACDTSSLVAYLQGEDGPDIDKLDHALAAGELVLPPVVVTEILSDPASQNALAAALPDVKVLDLPDGFWARAGFSRQTLKQHGLKCKIGDTLVAQSCIDHDISLIARDGDFRHFAKYCGLKLA
ncbi:MAG: PIN domain-containing protein [Alphaproteobacteria bacterium]|nr:PIN domain-containing protein [Alphaproteobacteria bacterium]